MCKEWAGGELTNTSRLLRHSAPFRLSSPCVENTARSFLDDKARSEGYLAPVDPAAFLTRLVRVSCGAFGRCQSIVQCFFVLLT